MLDAEERQKLSDTLAVVLVDISLNNGLTGHDCCLEGEKQARKGKQNYTVSQPGRKVRKVSSSNAA